MIIGIDFDGTCVTHEFPATGKDIGAVPVLKRLVEKGHRLILFTVRSNTDKGSSPGPHLDNAVQWFKDNDIPLFGVNVNPTQKHWSSSPKAYCNYYIDDAAVGCPLKTDPALSDRPFVNWDLMVVELSVKDIL